MIFHTEIYNNHPFERIVGPVSKGFEAYLYVENINKTTDGPIRIEVMHNDSPFVVKKELINQLITYTIK